VQTYYGENLQSSNDLATNACCTAGAPPKHIQECIAKLHPETVSKYYGCGLCLPDYDMTGLRVLDLGCGAGRDVYIASQLVGPTGHVVGVDMTAQQLAVARQHQAFHAEQFGFDNSNVQFLEGYLEQLDELEEELPEGSFDLIVSNCVLNLCTDKQKVLESCHKLLKEGGEMYFSDVYASRRVPMELQKDEVMWGECLSGALYWNDFENMAMRAGFGDPRLVEDAPITIQNATVQAVVDSSGSAGLEFYSATYRLWKIAELEPACEDFGQAVTYKGTIARAPSFWKLDKGHVFETGKIHPVCGNSWNMLAKTAVRDHFEFTGDFSRHYGIFEGCGSNMPYDRVAQSTGKGASSPQSGGGGGSCC